MNKHIVEEFYYLALRDLRDGATVQELEDVIKLYEEVEDYEACAGILKAIDESKYLTINNISQILKYGTGTD